MQDLLENPANHSITLQTESPAMPSAARFTEGGEHVVLLNAVPPFVNVFDRAGALVRSFVNKGGGPTEMLAPYALATKGDSLVLVLDFGGGAREYRIDGNQIASARFPVRVLSAAASCGSKWFLYGLRFVGDPKETYWIHEVSLTGEADSPSVHSELPGTPSPEWNAALGRPHGITEVAGTVTFLMDFLRPQRLATWTCATRHLDSAHVQDWEDKRLSSTKGSGPSRGLGVLPGTRVSTGVARIGDRDVLSAFVVQNEPYTLFRVLGEQDAFTVRVRGAYILLDYKPAGGVLLTSADQGTVFAIDSERFLQALLSAK